MRRNLTHIIMLAAVAVLVLVAPQRLDARPGDDDIYDLSLDENIEYPEIKNSKSAKLIREYQATMIEAFTNYEVSETRDGEVIVVTLPASTLFNANDTVLTSLGEARLKPFLRLLKNPGFYKLLLVMHSDNTGSSEYTLNLTTARVNSVYDWFDENGSVDYVVPYALGDSDPLVDNNSIENRKLNRRLDIYLVPEHVMLEQAKKGKVHIGIMSKDKN